MIIISRFLSKVFRLQKKPCAYTQHITHVRCSYNNYQIDQRLFWHTIYLRFEVNSAILQKTIKAFEMSNVNLIRRRFSKSNSIVHIPFDIRADYYFSQKSNQNIGDTNHSIGNIMCWMVSYFGNWNIKSFHLWQVQKGIEHYNNENACQKRIEIEVKRGKNRLTWWADLKIEKKRYTWSVMNIKCKHWDIRKSN